MLSYEFAILDWIQANMRNPIMDLLMPAITALGNSGLIWLLLAGVLLLTPQGRRGGAGRAGAGDYLLQYGAEAPGGARSPL